MKPIARIRSRIFFSGVCRGFTLSLMGFSVKPYVLDRNRNQLTCLVSVVYETDQEAAIWYGL